METWPEEAWPEEVGCCARGTPIVREPAIESAAKAVVSDGIVQSKAARAREER
jgi:hypothetical protein